MSPQNDFHTRCLEHTAALSKLTEKVDNLCNKVDSLAEKVHLTNGRVKALEIWRAGLVGAVAVAMLPSAGKIVALLQP
jgi:hypothetical protein